MAASAELAAEFVVVYKASVRSVAVHHVDCSRHRGRVKEAAHVGALSNGAGLAICCLDHESRLFDLGRKVGAF